MKKLKVALVHEDTLRYYDRMMGMWSYDVPEFEVTHFGVKKTQDRSRKLDRQNFNNFDLVFWEDHEAHIRWVGSSDVPLVYYVGDSTLSHEHYWRRCLDAPSADLILVDHDQPKRFAHIGHSVCRCGHCVNDHLFYDYDEPRSIDVSFQCRTKDAPERKLLDKWLRELCALRGYCYLPAPGGSTPEQYARNFNRSKMTINETRAALSRPHRVLDAMACRTCLVTSTLPNVSGEDRQPRIHYVEWATRGELRDNIQTLLRNGDWQRIADEGHDFVHQNHTWAIRAQELRELLRKELGL